MSEVKVRRAWNGKLGNLDGILAWMYDTDVLNKTDKAAKDTIFYRYYRFHNDGDRPYGYAYASARATEVYLEESVNHFLREMIRKYSKKVNRQDYYRFKADQRFKSTKASEPSSTKISGLLNEYFAGKYIEDRNLEAAKKKLEELKALKDEVRALEVEIAREIKKDFQESKYGSQILKELSDYHFNYTYGYVNS